MAEKKAEAAAEAAPPKKKGKLMLFIIVGALLLFIIVGAAAFLLLKKPAAQDEEEGDVPAKVDKAKKKEKKNASAAPVFYKFDKPFTVKLVSEGSENYLQAEIQAKLQDIATADQMKAYDPEIKHKVNVLLLGKQVTDLNNPKGVQTLSNEVRDTINRILDPSLAKDKKAGPATDDADPDAPVQMILFTTFILQ